MKIRDRNGFAATSWRRLRPAGLILASLLVAASPVRAQEAAADPSSAPTSDRATTSSPRAGKHLGIYASLLGDPVPSIFGINVAYQFAERYRLHAGLGTAFLVSNWGAGFDYVVLPENRFSPVVGLAYSRVNFGTLEDALDGIFGIKGDGTSIEIGTGALRLGAEWQDAGGFNVSGGLNVGVFDVGEAMDPEFFVLPYFQLGWFF